MRLIDADELVDIANEQGDVTIDDIINVETVYPFRCGRWITMRDPYDTITGWIHEECGTEVTCAWNFCPICGAKMDLEE